MTCSLSVLQAVLVYWSTVFCQIYSLKWCSRNYSEMCAKFIQTLRQMLHSLQFLCMQIHACHLSKGIITSSFISWKIIHFGLCFQHLRSCPALYFVMDPYFGIKLNLLLDLWNVVLSSIHISMRFLVIIITQSTCRKMLSWIICNLPLLTNQAHPRVNWGKDRGQVQNMTLPCHHNNSLYSFQTKWAASCCTDPSFLGQRKVCYLSEFT